MWVLTKDHREVSIWQITACDQQVGVADTTRDHPGVCVSTDRCNTSVPSIEESATYSLDQDLILERVIQHNILQDERPVLLLHNPSLCFLRHDQVLFTLMLGIATRQHNTSSSRRPLIGPTGRGGPGSPAIVPHVGNSKDVT